MGPERASALASLIAILNILDEGVLVEDARGRPLFWNESFAKFFGIRHSDLADFRETLQRLGSGPREESVEIAFTTLHGEQKYGLLRSKAISFGIEGAMNCYFIRDVTDLRFLENLLQRSETEEPLEALRPREILHGGARLIDGLLRARGIQLEVSGADESEELLGRRSHLQHVVSQLVRRSVEHSDPGGSARVSVSWVARGDRIEIEVNDPAVGASTVVSMATRERELRARVCRQLVERMGGSLEIDDAKALFRISLPRVRSILRV